MNINSPSVRRKGFLFVNPISSLQKEWAARYLSAKRHPWPAELLGRWFPYTNLGSFPMLRVHTTVQPSFLHLHLHLLSHIYAGQERLQRWIRHSACLQWFCSLEPLVCSPTPDIVGWTLAYATLTSQTGSIKKVFCVLPILLDKFCTSGFHINLNNVAN